MKWLIILLIFLLALTLWYLLFVLLAWILITLLNPVYIIPLSKWALWWILFIISYIFKKSSQNKN